MDLVVWGHEHECLIDPQRDHEMGFHIIQPGSTVATSLIAGEAAQKQVSVLKITGKEFQSETISLKTVRPFVTKDVILQDEPGMKKLSKRENNRSDITRHLEGIVEQMIDEANSQWLATQNDDDVASEVQQKARLPLIRLRVEYTAPEGGKFDCENPQRFSRRFEEKVANVNDVVQFHRKKVAVRKAKDGADIQEEEILSRLTIDSVKVEKLVREYLTAQALTILPQNSFGDAVTQFVDKDDKHAMEAFVEGSLGDQVKHLLSTGEADEEEIVEALGKHRERLEELFAGGKSKKYVKRKLKPKPANWDSDMDGEWAEQPGALQFSEHEDNRSDEDAEDVGSNVRIGSTKSSSTRGHGRGRAGKANGAPRTTAPARPSSNKKSGISQNRSKKKSAVDEEEDDLVMLDNDNHQYGGSLQPSHTMGRQATSTRVSRGSSTQKPPARAATGRQTMLNFSQPASQPHQTNRQGPFELVRTPQWLGYLRSGWE